MTHTYAAWNLHLHTLAHICICGQQIVSSSIYPSVRLFYCCCLVFFGSSEPAIDSVFSCWSTLKLRACVCTHTEWITSILRQRRHPQCWVADAILQQLKQKRQDFHFYSLKNTLGSGTKYRRTEAEAAMQSNIVIKPRRQIWTGKNRSKDKEEKLKAKKSEIQSP